MIGMAVVFLSAAALVVVFEVGRRVWLTEAVGRCTACEGSGRIKIPGVGATLVETWCRDCRGTGRRPV